MFSPFELVLAARFRQDLYYRLNVFPVEVAPLRERAEDIPLFAAHFVDRLAQKLNKPRPRLTRASVMRLQAYDWPGNVRELQNVIERGLITSRAGVLTLDLPEGGARAGTSSVPDDVTEVVPDAEMCRRERANTLAALEMTGWRISGSDGAAALLGLKPTTLASRLKKLGLRRK